MARIRTLVIGGAIGAALTYLLDPKRGPERRAELGAAIGRGRRELDRLGQRIRALGAGAEPMPAAGLESEDDLTILSRVESLLYAMPGFPRSTVEAEVVDGRLFLRGEVESAGQADEIVQTASQVRSVTAVENLLRVRGET